MTWKEVTTSDLFRDAPPEERAEYKRQFFQRYGVDTLRQQGLDDDEINVAANEFFNRPDDTGEGLLRSAVGSAARGFLDPLAAVPEVAGAFTGIESLEELGGDIRSGIERMAPVNPAQEGFVTDLAGVAGQVGQIAATGGLGAASGIGLAGKAATKAAQLRAASLGAKAAQQGAMGASAVAGGLERADQLGLEGGDRLIRGLLAGGTELATEKLGGFASELGPINKFLGGSVESGWFEPIKRGILTESGEEMGAETAGQLTDIAMSDKAPAMDLKQIAYAGLLGGAGGAMFGGVEAAIAPKTAQAYKDSGAFVPVRNIADIPADIDAGDDTNLVYDSKGNLIGYKQKTTVESDLPGKPPADVDNSNVALTDEDKMAAASVIYDLRSDEVGEALDLDDIELALDIADRKIEKGQGIDWAVDRMWLPNISTSSVSRLKKLLSSKEGTAALRARIDTLRAQDQQAKVDEQLPPEVKPAVEAMVANVSETPQTTATAAALAEDTQSGIYDLGEADETANLLTGIPMQQPLGGVQQFDSTQLEGQPIEDEPLQETPLQQEQSSVEAVPLPRELPILPAEPTAQAPEAAVGADAATLEQQWQDSPQFAAAEEAAAAGDMEQADAIEAGWRAENQQVSPEPTGAVPTPDSLPERQPTLGSVGEQGGDSLIQDDDGFETLKDIAKMRREQGRPDAAMESRIAAIEAARRGEEVDSGKTFSNVVVGHPQFDAPHPELRNLIPIYTRSQDEAQAKFDTAYKLLMDVKERIGAATSAAMSAKTPAQKKAADKKFPSSETSRLKDVADYLQNETLPELDRLINATPPPPQQQQPATPATQETQPEAAAFATQQPAEETGDAGVTQQRPLSRSKPREAIVFKKPIKTPLGNVIGYSWSSQIIEDVDKDGEAIFRRISNWDEAANNAETGRDIVHRFQILKPDGTTSEVSLESTLGKMTAGDKKTVKAVISAAKRLPFMRAELAELKGLQAAARADYDRSRTLKPDRSKLELREPDAKWLRERNVKQAYLDGVFLENIEAGDLTEGGEIKNQYKFWNDNTWKWQGAQIKAQFTDSQKVRMESLERSIKKAESLLKDQDVTVSAVTVEPTSLAESGPPDAEMKNPSVTTGQPASISASARLRADIATLPAKAQAAWTPELLAVADSYYSSGDRSLLDKLPKSQRNRILENSVSSEESVALDIQRIAERKQREGKPIDDKLTAEEAVRRSIASITEKPESARAKAIQKGLAGLDWANMDTEQRRAAVNKFAQSAARSLLNGASNLKRDAKLTLHEDRSPSAKFDVSNGSLSIEIGTNVDFDGLSFKDSEEAVLSQVFAAIEEEFMHAAHGIAAFERWKKSGSETEFRDWFEQESFKDWQSIFASIGELRASGNNEAADVIEDTIFEATKLYHQDVPLEMLGAMMQQQRPAYKMYLELARMLAQVQLDSFTTETEFTRFVKAVNHIFTKVLGLMRKSAELVKSGALGEALKRDVDTLASSIRQMRQDAALIEESQKQPPAATYADAASDANVLIDSLGEEQLQQGIEMREKAPEPTLATVKKLDQTSETLAEAKAQAVEALRDAMNAGKGKFVGRNITLTVTPSTRDDVMLQVTRFNNDGEPQGHQDIITEQDFDDELKDQDNLDVVIESIRPDIGQARVLNAFGIPKLRKPVSFNYQLRLREVGPGTTPPGFISASGRDVSYDRPLTIAEMENFEIKPVGATALNQRKSILRQNDGSVIRTGVTQRAAEAARNSYDGVIPGVADTWLGTVAEFAEQFPDGIDWGDGNMSQPASDQEAGVAADGRSYVFIDRVQLLEGDMKRAEQYGTTPQGEAVKRLLRHESFGHRGAMSLPAPLRNRFVDMIASGVIPEAELDYIVNERGYSSYAGWRNDIAKQIMLGEEWLAHKMEGIRAIPQSGPMAQMMDWLRDVWAWLTGAEKAMLPELRDMMREMHRALGALKPQQRVVDGTRASYIGESAIENMPEERKQFMRDSLDTAKAMATAGKSSEEIRAVTGWFPGIGKGNEKLRWELPDNDAALRLDEYRAAREEGDSAREIVSRFYADKKQRDMEEAQAAVVGKPMEFIRELSKKLKASQQSDAEMLQSFYAGEANPNRLNNRVPLGYILDHPQLFEMYPELKSVPVSFNAADASDDATEDGSFNPSTGILFLSPLGFSQKNKTLSTTLHEIQHWIQGKEGFARGGNADAMRKMNDFIGLAVNRANLAKYLRNAADLQDSVGGFSNDVVSNLPEDQIDIAFAAYHTEEDKWIPSDELRKKAEKLDKQILDADITGYEAYRRLAGEIESRDIQARQRFTPAQRAAIAPYSSENIAPEDAIVMFGGGTRASLQQSPLDAEYFAAIEAGDMEKAQRMVDEAARGAGYDSPIVYHGTHRGKFTKFKNKTSNSFSGIDGYYFSPDRKVAEGYGRNAMAERARDGEGRVIAAYLKNATYLPDASSGGSESAMIGGEYVVTDPNQIKSADPVTYADDGSIIPLYGPNGRFKSTSNDIRYSRQGPANIRNQPAPLTSPETKNTAPNSAIRSIAEMQAGLDGVMEVLPLKYHPLANEKGAQDALKAYADDLIAPYKGSVEKLRKLLSIVKSDVLLSSEMKIGARSGSVVMPSLLNKAAILAAKLGNEPLRMAFMRQQTAFASSAGQDLWANKAVKMDTEFSNNYVNIAMDDTDVNSVKATVDPLINTKGDKTVNDTLDNAKLAGDEAADAVAAALEDEAMISMRVLELGALAQEDAELRGLLEELIATTIDLGELAEADIGRASIAGRRTPLKFANAAERDAAIEKLKTRQTEILTAIKAKLAKPRKPKADTAAKEPKEPKEAKTPKEKQPAKEKEAKPVQTAKQIINKIISAAQRKEKKPADIDMVRELYRLDLKKPMNEAAFLLKAKIAGLDLELARELKDAIDLELTAIAIEAAFRAESNEQDRAIKKAEEELNRYQKQAESKINEIADALADPSLTKDKQKAINPFKVLYDQQIKNPLSMEQFVAEMSALNVFEQTAKQLFDIAAMDAQAREAIQAAKDDARIAATNLKKRNVSEARASELIYAQEEQLRQGSKDREESKSGDSINKAFRDQVSKPMALDAFIARLDKLKVSAKTAERLFKTAGRVAMDDEMADLMKKRNAFLDIDSSALAAFVNKMRASGKMTGEKKAKWGDILSLPVADQETMRAELLDRISKHDALRNLSTGEQIALADALDAVWQRERRKIFKRMIKRADMKGVDKATQEKIANATPALLKFINQGMLGSDAFYLALGEQFNIQRISKEDRAKVEQLAAEMQAPDVSTMERTIKSEQIAKILQKNSTMSYAELASSVWVVHVLTGGATLLDMGLGFMTGALSVIKKAINVAAIGKPGLALQGLSDFGRFLWIAGKEAIGNVVRPESGILAAKEASMMAYMQKGAMGAGLTPGDRLQLIRDEPGDSASVKANKKIQRTLGRWLSMWERIMGGLDHFNSVATTHGTMRLAAALNPKLYDEALIPSHQDYKNMMVRAKARMPDGTPKAQSALARSMIYDGVHLLGKGLEEGKMEQWRGMVFDIRGEGFTASFQEDPSGLGGILYNGIKSMTDGLEVKTREFRDKQREKFKETKGVGPATLINRAAGEMGYVLATQAQNIMGSRFIRFTGNKLNELISYTPFIGLARLQEAGMSRDGLTNLRAKNIYHNQALSIVALIAYMYMMQRLDDDEEEKNVIVEGSWDNLTPARKSQLMSDGFKPNTIRFKMSNGQWVSGNFTSWPFAGWLAAFGTVSDYKRYTPAKWTEKEAMDKTMLALYSGAFAITDISSLSQLMEMFGKSTYSTDPVKTANERLIKGGTSFLGGFVPRIAKDIDSWFDHTAYKPKDTWGHLAKEVPYLRRSSGAPIRDIFYEKVEVTRSPWSRAIKVSPDDPAYQKLARLNSRGIWLTPPNPENRKVRRGGATRALTEDEAAAYMSETGAKYKEFIMKRGDALAKMDADRAADLIEKTTARIREIALKRAIARGGRAVTVEAE